MRVREAYLGGRDRPGTWQPLHQGKVRDLYALDDERLLFVATDRVSAFDVVMREGVPDKGRVLTAISVHWFARTRGIVANHLITDSLAGIAGLDEEWSERLEGRALVVRRCRPTPVEWVVRGYLAGSGLKEYRRSRTVCGIPLPEGLLHASRLPAPILTPTTKGAAHDRPLTPDEARALVGPELYARAEGAALELYRLASRELEARGVLLADTKFEFGQQDGELLLIDECLTPDSSRFWPAEGWEPGRNPASLDKQLLRDHLETLDWDKSPPPPEVDPSVLARLRERYLEICERITGALPPGL